MLSIGFKRTFVRGYNWALQAGSGFGQSELGWFQGVGKRFYDLLNLGYARQFISTAERQCEKAYLHTHMDSISRACGLS